MVSLTVFHGIRVDFENGLSLKLWDNNNIIILVAIPQATPFNYFPKIKKLQILAIFWLTSSIPIDALPPSLNTLPDNYILFKLGTRQHILEDESLTMR